MTQLPPYACSGLESAGNAEFYDANNVWVTTLVSSACFAEWYCVYMGYTYKWRDGVNPDDPTTWPRYEPPVDPEEPPTEPTP